MSRAGGIPVVHGREDVNAEPDEPERAALGAALAEPVTAEVECLRAELEHLYAKVAGYETATAWNTSCTACARVLDSAYAETVRAERAEAALAEAATAERERIAQLAASLGAHYHNGWSGQSAQFAAYLRPAAATKTRQQGATP